MSINPYKSPDSASESAASKPGWLKARLIELLVIVGIIGILIGLLLPARRSAREAGRRSQCNNNLKQISLALLNYESVYHSLPPAYTVDAEGKPLHSWRTLILPFMEQQALYDTIDLSKPWDDPVNKAALETDYYVFRCPSAGCPKSHTTYLAVVAPGGCFRPTEPRRLAEIADDPAWTLMVVEVDSEHAVHWMSPLDAGEELILNQGTASKPPHPGGFQAAFVAGNTQFLRADLEAAELRALISIDGHDDAVARRAKQ